MKKRLFCTICTLLIFCSVANIFAQKQSAINLPLHRYLNAHNGSSEQINLALKGDLSFIKNAVEQASGQYVREVSGFHYIRIPLKAVNSLNVPGKIDRIYFSLGKGTPLNDTAAVHVNVPPVHNGTSPIPYSIKGNGSIIGIIDTGIDFTHPDFQDALGNSRILRIWDQTVAGTPPSGYSYGQEWLKSDIDGGSCTHLDQIAYGGHGTNVAGIASGNGNATGDFVGMAPEADLVIVATNFAASNWELTVADAIEWIFDVADAEGKPCVVNTSIGTYLGSHDGRDPAAVAISAQIEEKDGRSVVASAGNAGNKALFHLGTNVGVDTNFTWFNVVNGIGSFGGPAAYFELWSDTADFNNVNYCYGADKVTPSFSFRGRSSFKKITDDPLFTFLTDTIKNGANILALVYSYIELDSGRYALYVYIDEPDSSQYNFRLETFGNGKFDIWSGAMTGTSVMPYGTSLPDSATFPDIVNYNEPDSNQTIVSSWQCLDNVITVGNFVNRTQMTDINSNVTQFGYTPGDIYISSSRGPSRDGKQKPDISAPGELVVAAGNQPTLASLIGSDPTMVAPGGMHNRNGGTSMSSPVTAGVLALYYSSCNIKANSQAMSDLISSAKTDNFTGSSLPDNRWGFGKVDAANLLTVGAFSDTLIATGASSGCDTITAAINFVADSVLWSNGVTDTVQQLIVPGSYYAYMFENTGCYGITDTIIVNSVIPIILDSTKKSNPSCFNDSTGSLQVFYSGGSGSLNYLWSNGDSVSLALALDSGLYSVTVTDSLNCSEVFLDSLSNPVQLSLTMSGINPNCFGDSTGSVNQNSSGGTGSLSFLWSDSSTDTVISFAQARVWSLTVSDSLGCMEIDSVILTQPDSFTVSISSTNVTCFGYSDGNAMVTSSGSVGGHSYVWSNLDSLNTIDSLVANTFYVTITDSIGCTFADSVVVSSPNILAVSDSIVHVICPGILSGQIYTFVTGGNGGYSYLWNDASAQDSSVAVNLGAGNYVALVTDSLGCTINDSVTVTQPDSFTVSISSVNNSCFGFSDGSASVISSGATGPHSFLWSNTDTLNSIDSLLSSIFYVTITDSIGCTWVDSTFISGPTALAISDSIIPASCPEALNGQIYTFVSGGNGGYSYLWNDTTSQDSSVAINLGVGDFMVIVTDSLGCVDSITSVITSSDSMFLNLNSVDPECSSSMSGSALVSVTGGSSPYAYLWNDPTAQTDSSATGLGGGIYVVVVTDNGGCAAQDSIILQEPLYLNVGVSVTDVSCAGDSNGTGNVNVSGGITPYSYTWDDSQSQTSASATGLASGTYNVTITSSNNCVVVTTADVGSPDQLVVSGTVQDSSFTADIDAFVAGGTPPFSFLWSDGSSSEDLFGITQQGTYVVTVTDNNGCLGSIAFNVAGIVYSEELNENSHSATIYPNPNIGSFNLYHNSEQDDVQFKLYDITGREMVMEAERIGSKRFKFETSVSSGRYFLSIFGEESELLHTFPLVISR